MATGLLSFSPIKCSEKIEYRKATIEVNMQTILACSFESSRSFFFLFLFWGLFFFFLRSFFWLVWWLCWLTRHWGFSSFVQLFCSLWWNKVFTVPFEYIHLELILIWIIFYVDTCDSRFSPKDAQNYIIALSFRNSPKISKFDIFTFIFD